MSSFDKAEKKHFATLITIKVVFYFNKIHLPRIIFNTDSEFISFIFVGPLL